MHKSQAARNGDGHKESGCTLWWLLLLVLPVCVILVIWFQPIHTDLFSQTHLGRSDKPVFDVLPRDHNRNTSSILEVRQFGRLGNAVGKRSENAGAIFEVSELAESAFIVSPRDMQRHSDCTLLVPGSSCRNLACPQRGSVCDDDDYQCYCLLGSCWDQTLGMCNPSSCPRVIESSRCGDNAECHPSQGSQICGPGYPLDYQSGGPSEDKHKCYCEAGTCYSQGEGRCIDKSSPEFFKSQNAQRKGGTTRQCTQACREDQCRASATNDIPDGSQWYNVGWGSQMCCASTDPSVCMMCCDQEPRDRNQWDASPGAIEGPQSAEVTFGIMRLVSDLQAQIRLDLRPAHSLVVDLSQPDKIPDPGACELDTGGTCGWMPCSEWRGPTDCVKGRCMCPRGLCALKGTCQDVQYLKQQATLKLQCPESTGHQCNVEPCPELLGNTTCSDGFCSCGANSCFDGKGFCQPRDKIRMVFTVSNILFANMNAADKLLVIAIFSKTLYKSAGLFDRREISGDVMALGVDKIDVSLYFLTKPLQKAPAFYKEFKNSKGVEPALQTALQSNKRVSELRASLSGEMSVKLSKAYFVRPTLNPSFGYDMDKPDMDVVAVSFTITNLKLNQFDDRKLWEAIIGNGKRNFAEKADVTPEEVDVLLNVWNTKQNSSATRVEVHIVPPDGQIQYVVDAMAESATPLRQGIEDFMYMLHMHPDLPAVSRNVNRPQEKVMQIIDLETNKYPISTILEQDQDFVAKDKQKPCDDNVVPK